MKIFLSWSGDRSKAVALALRDWLPLVLYYAQPWLSERDIAAGDRWASEVGKELEGSHFGIIALTSDNLTAPWILFEAGALSKAFSAGAVCPYLVDLDFKDVAGPLSQFQAKKSDRTSTLELVQSINVRASSPIESGRLEELFDALWPRLDDRLRGLPARLATGSKPRSEPQILEELVTAVRRMDSRLEALTHSLPARLQVGRPPEIRVTVEGHFPALGEAKEISYSPDEDVVEEIAAIAGVDAEEYGQSWHLRDSRGDRMVEREDGRRLASRARQIPLRLILTRAPF